MTDGDGVTSDCRSSKGSGEVMDEGGVTSECGASKGSGVVTDI